MDDQQSANLQRPMPHDGVDLFLERFCSRPELLNAAFKRPRRMVSTSDGGVLCEKGDEANGIWIVAEGMYRIEDDGKLIGTRRAGELIGEQAFYRPSPDGQIRIRGNSIKAVGSSSALRIDSSGVM